MHHKKDYIIVKDRHPYISEVLNDCINLCVPTKRNEPLSSILQKMCSKITNNFTQLSNQISEINTEIGELPVYSLVDGENTTVSGSGTELDPWMVNVADPTVYALEEGNNITITGDGSVGDPWVISTDFTPQAYTGEQGILLDTGNVFKLGGNSTGAAVLMNTFRYFNLNAGQGQGGGGLNMNVFRPTNVGTILSTTPISITSAEAGGGVQLHWVMGVDSSKCMKLSYEHMPGTGINPRTMMRAVALTDMAFQSDGNISFFRGSDSNVARFFQNGNYRVSANAFMTDSGAKFQLDGSGSQIIFQALENSFTEVFRIHQGGKFGWAAGTPTSFLHLKAGTIAAATSPAKFTSGPVMTAAEAGAMEYNNTFHLTNSDATRRHIVLAPNTTKVTAAAPYTNDGYITVNIGGTNFNLMTTA
jgi:hypothetical protein